MSRGIAHLDAVVISHADADHFNALPALLERFSVDVVYFSDVMVRNDNPALAVLFEAVNSAGVPVREIHSGVVLGSTDTTRIEVLHPPPGGIIGSDNANSIVLSIEYASRCVLLPGDLESPGCPSRRWHATCPFPRIMAASAATSSASPAGAGRSGSSSAAGTGTIHGRSRPPIRKREAKSFTQRNRAPCR